MTAPAILAAHLATDANAALLNHAREGEGFGDVEVVEKLAEALILAIGIHTEVEVEACDHGYRKGLGRLSEECARFIESWAG